MATGVLGLVMRNNAANAFNNAPNCVSIAGVPQGGAFCTSQHGTMETWQAVSIAGFVTGGLLLGGATILWVTTAPSAGPSHAARARLYPTGGPGTLGLGMGGAW